MARFEIQIQEINKSDEPDWESMGVTKPKGNRSYKFRRCLIDTVDMEYIKEYTEDKTILKCTWMEDSVIIAGKYDDILIKINDLENANMEE